jgi:hypothetical protein
MSTKNPCIYKPETGEKLAKLVADGVPLAEACKQVGVARAAPYEWLTTSEEWALLYARAREMLAHKYAAEVVTIADDQELPPDSAGSCATAGNGRRPSSCRKSTTIGW